MNISIVKGDITKIHVEAIVNAANTSLLGGSGVDGAIHRVGGQSILDECIKIKNKQGNCKVGEAVITTAGRLPAKYVIHAVGPVWRNGENKEQELLYRTYSSCLDLAENNQIKVISFPCISTGIYRFPKLEAANTALKAIKAHSYKPERIVIVCYDDENLRVYNSLINNNA
ncbi:macro domain-containing protein [Sphingobacterium multivorum]|uniref:macro domain-containing protein n=1 Tax=Sphingobacterium multivorum TaxID=28454 RepID=UPI003DA3AC2A